MGDIPGIRGVQGGSVCSVLLRLDCHKNSDLKSKSATGTV